MLQLTSQPGSPEVEIRKPPRRHVPSVRFNPILQPGKTREKTRRSDLEEHRVGDTPPLPKLLADGLPQFRPRQLGDDWLPEAQASVRELLPRTGQLEPLLVDEVSQEATLVLPLPPPPPPPLPTVQVLPSQASRGLSQSSSRMVPASAKEPPKPEPPKPEPAEPPEPAPPEFRELTKARRVGVVSVANAVAASGTHNVLLGLRDFLARPAMAGSVLIGIRNLAKLHEFEINDDFTHFINQAHFIFRCQL